MTDSNIPVFRAQLRYESIDDFIEGYSRFILPGKMFIPLDAAQLKPVDSRVRFEFRLADGSRALVGEGIVKQVRDQASAGGPTGLIVKYTHLSRRSKQLVGQIVDFKRAQARERNGNKQSGGMRPPSSSNEPVPTGQEEQTSPAEDDEETDFDAESQEMAGEPAASSASSLEAGDSAAETAEGGEQIDTDDSVEFPDDPSAQEVQRSPRDTEIDPDETFDSGGELDASLADQATPSDTVDDTGAAEATAEADGIADMAAAMQSDSTQNEESAPGWEEASEPTQGDPAETVDGDNDLIDDSADEAGPSIEDAGSPHEVSESDFISGSEGATELDDEFDFEQSESTSGSGAHQVGETEGGLQIMSFDEMSEEGAKEFAEFADGADDPDVDELFAGVFNSDDEGGGGLFGGGGDEDGDDFFGGGDADGDDFFGGGDADGDDFFGGADADDGDDMFGAPAEPEAQDNDPSADSALNEAFGAAESESLEITSGDIEDEAPAPDSAGMPPVSPDAQAASSSGLPEQSSGLGSSSSIGEEEMTRPAPTSEAEDAEATSTDVLEEPPDFDSASEDEWGAEEESESTETPTAEHSAVSGLKDEESIPEERLAEISSEPEVDTSASSGLAELSSEMKEQEDSGGVNLDDVDSATLEADMSSISESLDESISDPEVFDKEPTKRNESMDSLLAESQAESGEQDEDEGPNFKDFAGQAKDSRDLDEALDSLEEESEEDGELSLNIGADANQEPEKPSQADTAGDSLEALVANAQKDIQENQEQEAEEEPERDALDEVLGEELPPPPSDDFGFDLSESKPNFGGSDDDDADGDDGPTNGAQTPAKEEAAPADQSNTNGEATSNPPTAEEQNPPEQPEGAQQKKEKGDGFFSRFFKGD